MTPEEWQLFILSQRIGLTRTERGIRKGRTAVKDVEAMCNFHKIALMLMNQVTPEQWQVAERDALIGAYMHKQIEDKR